MAKWIRKIAVACVVGLALVSAAHAQTLHAGRGWSAVADSHPVASAAPSELPLTPAAVPEPATMGLLILGGLVLLVRRAR